MYKKCYKHLNKHKYFQTSNTNFRKYDQHSITLYFIFYLIIKMYVCWINLLIYWLSKKNKKINMKMN